MVRNPIVAGQFYESDYDRLYRQINKCFNDKFGPGEFSSKRKEKKIKGIISPHAGYIFSGSCAAWGYKEIAEACFPDVFVIIGVSHEGYESCLSREDWITPLGNVKVDKQMVDLISKKTGLSVNERAHEIEHSIEVQLPFLQFSCKDHIDDIRIVPIMISEDADIKETGNNIKQAVKESRKYVVFIVSSDFTHYGYNYGFTPFHDKVKERLYNLDQGAIDFILKKNSQGFIDYTKNTGATICGKYPIAALIESIDFKKSKLLMYYTSGDISGSYDNAVGYASILFE